MKVFRDVCALYVPYTHICLVVYINLYACVREGKLLEKETHTERIEHKNGTNIQININREIQKAANWLTGELCVVCVCAFVYVCVI